MLKITSSVIENTAGDIKSINAQLSQTLESSRAIVESMRSVWSGEAADSVIGAFIAFEAKYKAEYSQILNDYAAYLSGVAAPEYTQAESQGKNVADLI